MISRLRQLGTRIDGHSLELLQGSLFGFASRGVAAACVFAFNVVLARTLGAADAGLYYLGVAVISVASIISLLGIDTATVRPASNLIVKQHWARLATMYRRSMAIVFVASLLVAALIAVSADVLAAGLFARPDLATPLRYLAYALPTLGMLVLTSRYLQSMKRVALSLFFQTAAVPTMLLVVLLLIPAAWSIANVAIAYSLSALAMFLACLTIWLRAAPIRGETDRGYPMAELLQSSRALLQANIVNKIVQPWSAVLLLGVWGSVSDVAWFSAAGRVAALVAFAILPVNTILAPKIAVLAANGEYATLFRLARRATAIIVGIALPVVMAIAFAPNWIMSVFGPDFRGAGAILVVLTIGQAVNVLTGPVQSILVMTGNERLHRHASFLGGLTNVAMCVVLIPSNGAIGAAWAHAGGFAVTNVVSALFAWRLRHTSPG